MPINLNPIREGVEVQSIVERAGEKLPSLEVPPVDWLRLAQQIAARGKAMVIKRAFPATGPGSSREGNVFRPLNPAYAKLKAKLGREPVPNQRLTSRTATALGVLREQRRVNGATVVIGWRTRREIAEKLERRNAFIGHTEQEQAMLLAFFQERTQTEHAARIRVVNGRITIGATRSTTRSLGSALLRGSR